MNQALMGPAPEGYMSAMACAEPDVGRYMTVCDRCGVLAPRVESLAEACRVSAGHLRALEHPVLVVKVIAEVVPA